MCFSVSFRECGELTRRGSGPDAFAGDSLLMSIPHFKELQR